MFDSTLATIRRNTTRIPKGHPARKVVVFGAGVSAPAGIPLANELLCALVQWHEGKGSTSRLNSLYEFLDFFYPSVDRKNGVYPPFEDVLGMMDTAEAYSQIRASGRGYRWRPQAISELRSRLIRLMGEYLWSFQTPQLVTNLGALRSFVRQQGTNVVYATFNYDLLLETALSAEGIAFQYGLPPSASTATVLKPHGSINWFLRSTNFPTGIDRIDLGNQLSALRSLRALSLGANWKESVVIPPTPFKQVALRDLRSTWTSFSASIVHCRKLDIIGYSLPDADRLARIVLRRAGPAVGANKKVRIVNPGDVLAHFRRLVSPASYLYQMTFEEYVTSVLAA